VDIFVPNRRTNPRKGTSARGASGSEASDTKVSRSAARKGRLSSIQARSSEKTMKRHRPMRRSHNGVGAYHALLSEMLKKANMKGKSKAQQRKLFKGAVAKAKAALAAGSIAPSYSKGVDAKNKKILRAKKKRLALRGGMKKADFRALPASERAKIRVSASGKSGAKAPSKAPSAKKGGYTMKKFGKRVQYRGPDGKMISKKAYEAAVGKAAKAPSAKAPSAKAPSKPKATRPPSGGTAAAKPSVGGKVRLASKKDKKGRMQYRIDGKLVSKKTFDAAKKAAGKAGKAPSAAKGKGSRAKKNPNFAMVLDGTKQFGRDFFTLQSVGGAAVVGLAHGFVAPMVAQKLNEYVPQRVTIPGINVEVGASDFAFTATGLVAGAVLGGLGYALGRPNLGLGLGLLAAGSGVVIDTVGLVMGARGGSEMGSIDNRGDVYGAIDADGNVYGDVAYGDVAYGEIYDAVPGGPTVYGDVAYGDVAYGGVYAGGTMDYGAACASEYADAMAGDAQYSGADFSAAEGQALMDGPAAWMKRFGKPAKRATGVRSSMSRHAGKEGHRWGWLIKLVGMEKAKQIAALPPEKRLAVIDGLRKQAISSLANMMATQAAGSSTAPQTELTTAMAAAPQQNLLPAPQSMGLDLTGAAMGAGAAGSYGSVVYAGGGF
jgi:hypothetical protein